MLRFSLSGMLVLCGLVMFSPAGYADEYYSGGVTVDIDRDVTGYLWIEDATVNLYKNAHIKNDYYLGDVYISSGEIVNIYGGQIDNVMMLSTMYNGLPDPEVMVYGRDFAVDGVAVEPDTSELFLEGQTLSGTYADGSTFSYAVQCFQEGSVYLTLKLVWVDAAPATEPDIDAAAVDFGEVGMGSHGLQVATIANVGDGPLTIDSVQLEDETMQFFIADVNLPAVVEPNGVLEVGLVYVPAAMESASASLKVVSDDPDEQTYEIALSGVGTEAAQAQQLTPLEQMDEILAFFAQAVEDGTLEGVGRGHSAAHKLAAVGHLLQTTRYLIDHGYTEYAIKALQVIEQKTDGGRRPGDFVAGEALGELKRQISELMDALRGA